ncbi:MAG: hypothetical protein EOP76_16720 [Variovorax sp.]|nr:MAG: hypothetical protein EOP76_16720 [Variovorax sp.]
MGVPHPHHGAADGRGGGHAGRHRGDRSAGPTREAGRVRLQHRRRLDGDRQPALHLLRAGPAAPARRAGHRVLRRDRPGGEHRVVAAAGGRGRDGQLHRAHCQGPAAGAVHRAAALVCVTAHLHPCRDADWSGPRRRLPEPGADLRTVARGAGARGAALGLPRRRAGAGPERHLDCRVSGCAQTVNKPNQSVADDTILRIHPAPSEIDPVAWNALLAQQAAPSPFMRHEYLTALHESGSAVPASGWTASFAALWQGGQMTGACPLYVKDHSYGEYVFDWAWANAYEQHGLAYYPKAVIAVPFTPVPGARLLARDAQSRALLIQGLVQWCEQMELSSLHLLFGADEDVGACADAGLMLRHTVQFHWTNSGWSDFDAALSADGANGGPEVAYGRYWGAIERVDCLHFEACYYQPLQWCIAHGVQRFEGGAQGEHKMARALMPVRTTSAHWLAHPSFADAVERFLAREGEGIANYMEHLDERSPFRAPPA